MIRVGLIGCGAIAAEYLSRLDALGGRVSVTAFCDLDVGRARSMAEGRDARVYADYRAMLESEPLDAVFDNLPPFARADELALTAARRRAIFTTKPLGLDMATARRSLAAIEGAGVINSVGYMFRYSGITDRARELTAGRPVAMVLCRVIGAMPHGWSSRRSLSGGQIVEQSTHLIDLARYFAGDVATVYALGRTGTVPDRVDYEDVSVLALDFTSGAVGSVVSTCAVRQFFWGCTLIGRDLHLDLVFDEWTLRGRVDGQMVDEHIPVAGYQEQITAFVRAVELGDQSSIRCSYRDAVGTFATTLAATRSLVSGLPEPVF